MPYACWCVHACMQECACMNRMTTRLYDSTEKVTEVCCHNPNLPVMHSAYSTHFTRCFTVSTGMLPSRWSLYIEVWISDWDDYILHWHTSDKTEGEKKKICTEMNARNRVPAATTIGDDSNAIYQPSLYSILMYQLWNLPIDLGRRPIVTQLCTAAIETYQFKTIF